ncbi:hypothetical protein UFOVP130_66 [uncultured Caudovirales phage]|uniref:Uncharacterized protein n=1 Tax=uncultured Caudovirales phage TaxID=2100421 RepID=A0A6J5LCI9_9CAUD|nr:hypothetical protein UFOVP130_66 [uncultured Caudovirales phage]
MRYLVTVARTQEVELAVDATNRQDAMNRAERLAETSPEALAWVRVNQGAVLAEVAA